MARTPGRTTSLIALAVTSLLTAATSVAAQGLDGALGVWADEDGISHIRIAPCGQRLCGHIIWLEAPNHSDGRPKTDDKNPDKTLRKRPLLGLTILSGLRPDRKRSKLKGRVYNAQDGNTYDVYLHPRGSRMKVEGCFFGILCGSQVWTRVR